jgi:hypothetical protein
MGQNSTGMGDLPGSPGVVPTSFSLYTRHMSMQQGQLFLWEYHFGRPRLDSKAALEVLRETLQSTKTVHLR